jgi:DNA polymerase-3 subunit epsilon
MSWNLGPMVAFDLETTGVDVDTARIVTACVAVIDGSGQRPPETMTWLVNPGTDIPEQATEIHGITTDHAHEYGRPASECVGEIALALFRANGPIVAFNACYDLTVLDREMRRHSIGVQLPDRLQVIDPFVLDKHIDRYRKGSRKLADTCDLYGVRLDGAHDASHDAIAAARVAWRIAQRYPEIAEMPLAELHALQVVAKREQDASFAEYLRGQARRVRDVDEQIALNARATAVTGQWPVTPYIGEAVA